MGNTTSLPSLRHVLSRHAVIRYLERIKNFDIESIKKNIHEEYRLSKIEEYDIINYLLVNRRINLSKIKKELLDDKVKEYIKKFPNCKILRSEYKIVVQNGIIVTIVPN